MKYALMVFSMGKQASNPEAARCITEPAILYPQSDYFKNK